MRVGIIANTFEESMGAVAGGHIHFIEVARRWDEFELVVFAPPLARDAIRKLLPQATFVALPDIGAKLPNRQLRYLARTIFAPLRYADIRNCDVILATSHFLPDLVPALLARRRRFMVCIQHILDPPQMRAGNVVANVITYTMQAVALRVTARFARSVLVNDHATAGRIGINRDRTEVAIMTNGIEHVKSESTSPETTDVAQANASGPSVLYLGRIVPTKGVDDLIAAWSNVAATIPNATLTIAGSGEHHYVESLRQMVSRETTRSVTFSGRVSDDEKRRLLRTATVFAFPSKEEGWGIVIAEAMAYGIPCVTYDLPAYRVPFIAGRLSAAVGDVNGFADLLIELLTDATRRERLGQEALILSKTFSWTVAARVEGEAIRRLANRI